MPFDPDELNDIDQLARIGDMVRSVTDEDFVRVEPPADLWASISAQLGDQVATAASDQPAPADATRSADATGTADTAAAAGDGSVAPVVSIAGRRRNGWRIVGAVAAAVVVIAGVGAVLTNRADEPVVVATAKLAQLENLGDTTATARLVQLDGVTELQITASDMPAAPEGERYELWLIDPEVTDPQSLGYVTGSGTIKVPKSVDPATHPIVDISLEPNDGDDHHSGHSLMRGTLS